MKCRVGTQESPHDGRTIIIGPILVVIIVISATDMAIAVFVLVYQFAPTPLARLHIKRRTGKDRAIPITAMPLLQQMPFMHNGCHRHLSLCEATLQAIMAETRKEVGLQLRNDGQ